MPPDGFGGRQRRHISFTFTSGIRVKRVKAGSHAMRWFPVFCGIFRGSLMGCLILFLQPAGGLPAGYGRREEASRSTVRAAQADLRRGAFPQPLQPQDGTDV